MPWRKTTEAVNHSPDPRAVRRSARLCDERLTEIVPGGARGARRRQRGANASQVRVTSPCRHRAGPSVTGQSAVSSRTARIQRCRAP
ncbi:hypothetical protein SUDANB105_04018 [Streptomyces sp. enrichment culture]